MHPIVAPWLSAAQGVLSAPLSSATALARHAVDGATTWSDLNATAGRSLLQRSSAATQQMMTLHSSYQLVLMGCEQSRSSLDNWYTYAQQVQALRQRTQLALHASLESEIAASRHKIDEFIEMTRQTCSAAFMPINTFFKIAF